jgi:hypothetical protein
MARTTFKINRDILQELRVKSGKKQMDVGLYLREKFGKPSSQSQAASATSVYQKIERTGHTSRNTAVALAQYFHVPLEALQGTEPVDTLKQITERVTRLLDEGRNEALDTAFDDAVKNTYHVGNGVGPNQEEKISWLAEDIAERIEAAQWARNPTELKKLTNLTGLTSTELLIPAYVRGNWWVVAKGLNLPEYFSNTATVVSSHNFLVRQIKEAWNASIPAKRYHDRTFLLSRDGLWYRIEMYKPTHINYEWGVDFVRCEPDGTKGVRWVATSSWDKYFLENDLKKFCYLNANVVIDFDGKRVPEDPFRLCFVVRQSKRGSDEDVAQMVVRGNAHEWTETQRSERVKENDLHFEIFSGLLSQLKRSLHPLLKSHPSEFWNLNDYQGISLTLAKPDHKVKFTDPAEPTWHYQITLMEERQDGSFIRAPWRENSIADLAKAVKQWLHDPLPDEYEDGAQFELLKEVK